MAKAVSYMLGICAPPSAVLYSGSLGSASSSASPRAVSYACRRFNVSHVSERQSSNYNFLRMSSSDKNNKTKLAAAQASNTTPAIQTDEVLQKMGSPLSVTYLEGNSWLWEIVGLKILVDPVLVGNLDFGIPWLYDASKRYSKNFKLEDFSEVDYVLITQGFDDHCHEKTLAPLSLLKPDLPIISSPNAKSILSKYFKNVTYLEPTGESITLKGNNGTDVIVRASPGPILGPPWQRPENGYFIEVKEPKFSIYLEPHCAFENANLQNQRADVLVTPVIKQVLPGYTLVSGQEDAVKVAEWLKPKFVIVMKNGDLDARGILSKIVQTQGTSESFEKLLSSILPDTEVLQPIPWVPLEVPIARQFQQ